MVIYYESMKDYYSSLIIKGFTHKVYLDYLGAKVAQGRLPTWLRYKCKLVSMKKMVSQDKLTSFE